MTSDQSMCSLADTVLAKVAEHHSSGGDATREKGPATEPEPVT